MMAQTLNQAISMLLRDLYGNDKDNNGCTVQLPFGRLSCNKRCYYQTIGSGSGL
jgi:hypothetical protein